MFPWKRREIGRKMMQVASKCIKFVIHAYPNTPKSWPPLNFQHQEILDQDIGIGELWRNTCTSSACAKSHETATHIKALRD